MAGELRGRIDRVPWPGRRNPAAMNHRRWRWGLCRSSSSSPRSGLEGLVDGHIFINALHGVAGCAHVKDEMNKNGDLALFEDDELMGII
ncbi:hypothetical protein IEQ34_004463 [Dendrobium chrysotoxum]|uniref:Uncharacterized protein n=1 Tax=Dendrobium chrysotoxum TaxID=161865 RepID=A0AAV7HIR5_DENCH|nr:hypothetical protein IEQ34_004463 [Dendrobium chrysotoxum]